MSKDVIFHIFLSFSPFPLNHITHRVKVNRAPKGAEFDEKMDNLSINTIIVLHTCCMWQQQSLKIKRLKPEFGIEGEWQQ
jgi:hypothetical protein